MFILKEDKYGNLRSSRGYFKKIKENVFKGGRTIHELNLKRDGNKIEEIGRGCSYKWDNPTHPRYSKNSWPLSKREVIKKVAEMAKIQKQKPGHEVYADISNGYFTLGFSNSGKFASSIEQEDEKLKILAPITVESYGFISDKELKERYNIDIPPDKKKLKREEGLRLSFLDYNYLSEEEKNDICSLIGKRTKELIERGYGHTSLHTDNIVVFGTAEKLNIKLTDGTDIFEIRKGDPTHYILPGNEGKKYTLSGLNESFVKINGNTNKINSLLGANIPPTDKVDDIIKFYNQGAECWYDLAKNFM